MQGWSKLLSLPSLRVEEEHAEAAGREGAASFASFPEQCSPCFYVSEGARFLLHVVRGSSRADPDDDHDDDEVVDVRSLSALDVAI